MYSTGFPVIDPVATGKNIRRMRLERGMTVKDLQSYFGFEEPRAIYKWQKGESLPSVDNLYALGKLFNVSMDQILIPVTAQLHMFGEQQAEPCCSSFLNACCLLLYLHIAQMSLNRQFNLESISVPKKKGSLRRGLPRSQASQVSATRSLTIIISIYYMAVLFQKPIVILSAIKNIVNVHRIVLYLI